MDEELELGAVFEALKRQVGNIHYFDFSNGTPFETTTLLRDSYIFDIIEKALKNLDEEKFRLRTCLRESKDEISSLRSFNLKLYNAKIVYQTKAILFEIIKDKSVDIGFLQSCSSVNTYNKYIIEHAWTKHTRTLTEEEFVSLKKYL